MTLAAQLNRRLVWRLFVANLTIVLVAVVVLATTAQLHAPAALARHTSWMQLWLADDPAVADHLRESFVTGVDEILIVAAVAAVGAALAVSLFNARRIVGPIRDMIEVSQHIAAGDYRQRVPSPDTDELEALAQALNGMAATLEQTEYRRLQLIGDVAHELRTPLTGIKSLMEAVVTGALPAEPATFMNVEREVSRLQRLVNDLTELSRAEAGQLTLEPRSIAIADVIASALDRLRLQFEDKGVFLCTDLSADVSCVHADPARLTQVLLNLVGNALQYTPPGGRVTVRAWQAQVEVVVAVEDTGIGISPEHLPRIFERFYRVDKSRSRVGGGSGIGLTIAKHLIEAHRGRISAVSPGTGLGSTFTFSLPVRDAA